MKVLIIRYVFVLLLLNARIVVCAPSIKGICLMRDARILYICFRKVTSSPGECVNVCALHSVPHKHYGTSNRSFTNNATRIYHAHSKMPR